VQNKKFDICGNHLFRLKEIRKRCRGVILCQKNDLKPPFLNGAKGKENLKDKSFSRY